MSRGVPLTPRFPPRLPPNNNNTNMGRLSFLAMHRGLTARNPQCITSPMLKSFKLHTQLNRKFVRSYTRVSLLVVRRPSDRPSCPSSSSR